MEVQHALLGFLETEPNYGYELKKLYDHFFGHDKPILSGQVYSTLSRLKRDGKVIETPADEASGGPERIKYQITNIGLEAFENWLQTPEAPAPHLQATLYVKTVLTLMRGGEAADFLDKQRHAHLQRMRELIKRRQASDLANRLLIDHALFHIEADIRWINLTESRLKHLKLELKEVNC